MGISNKSFKGLSTAKRSKVIAMNKDIGYSRAERVKVENWQTKHKGFGVEMDKREGNFNG